MAVINFDEIIGKGNNYITDNIFCIKHPTNCLKLVKVTQERQTY